MSGDFDVIDRQLKVPLEVYGRIGHFADEDVGPDATDVVNDLRLEQQIASGEQIVGDVILRAAHGDAVTDAQRAEDVEDFWVSSVFLQEGYDHFDVFFLRFNQNH